MVVKMEFFDLNPPLEVRQKNVVYEGLGDCIISYWNIPPFHWVLPAGWVDFASTNFPSFDGFLAGNGWRSLLCAKRVADTIQREVISGGRFFVGFFGALEIDV